MFVFNGNADHTEGSNCKALLGTNAPLPPAIKAVPEPKLNLRLVRFAYAK